MATNGKKHIHTNKKKIVGLKSKFPLKTLFLYSLLAIFVVFFFSSFEAASEEKKSVPLSQIISEVRKNQVAQITVTSNKLVVLEKNGSSLQAVKEPSSDVYTLFKNAGVSLADAKIIVKDEAGTSNWMNILFNVLPIVVMLGFFFFIFRQARGNQEGIFSFGQSRAKLFNRENSKVTFADVAGVDEAKQELSEIVDFLKHPVKYKAMGARTPKGVFRGGPGGTGKALLAGATAGEAGVAFSLWQDLNLWRCWSESEHRGFAIYSIPPKKRSPPLSLSMRLMR